MRLIAKQGFKLNRKNYRLSYMRKANTKGIQQHKELKFIMNMI